MATASSEMELVGRIIPLRSGANPALISLLAAASRATLEQRELTPLGATKAKVLPGTHSWVRQVWANDGNDPNDLDDVQVLVLMWVCVPMGGKD